MLILNIAHRSVTLPKPLDRRLRNRESDAKRRTTKEWRGWYNTPRWRAKRQAQLDVEPLCERHKAKDQVVIASVAHHVIRHNGDADLFWNGKLASSCKDCHDSIEQAIEVRGYEIGCDAKGRPIAPDHPWNIKR